MQLGSAGLEAICHSSQPTTKKAYGILQQNLLGDQGHANHLPDASMSGTLPASLSHMSSWLRERLVNLRGRVYVGACCLLEALEHADAHEDVSNYAYRLHLPWKLGVTSRNTEHCKN